jgi:hypothetical protein
MEFLLVVDCTGGWGKRQGEDRRVFAVIGASQGMPGFPGTGEARGR